MTLGFDEGLSGLLLLCNEEMGLLVVTKEASLLEAVMFLECVAKGEMGAGGRTGGDDGIVGVVVAVAVVLLRDVGVFSLESLAKSLLGCRWRRELEDGGSVAREGIMS